MHDLTPWIILALLGAYHGLNPGMGWLFAVALGLQERTTKAVVRSLGPIALGHAASVALVVALIAGLGTFVSTDVLRYAGGAALIGFGIYKLAAPFSHPRWVGMRVTTRDLVAWSFLMATAHGAGLMLLPFLLRSSTDDTAQAALLSGGHADHMAHAAQSTSGSAGVLPGSELLLVLVHSAAMFVAMGAVALGVYWWLGLKILRRGWFNVDRIWAVMLLVAGAFSFVV